jgi:hypothetical protein
MRLPESCSSILLIVACLPAGAAEPAAKVVGEGLASPCAVAFRPETDDVFVAECGAGRVVRIADNKSVELIGGFGKSVFGEGPKHDSRPLGLCFLDKSTLLVGGGNVSDGAELLRVYDLPALGENPRKLEDAQVVVTLSAPNEPEGKRHFRAMGASKDSVFLSVQGQNGQGWISRCAREGNKLATFLRYLPAETPAQPDPPLALIISPRGYLLIGQRGAAEVPKDSVLNFYHPKNKKVLMSLPTGLFDITGLAYSEKTGQLYATDVAWMASEEGGLFQLIAGQPGSEPRLQAQRIAKLDKPTALGFAKDGSLYVTVLGSGESEGKLLKFEPGL